MGLTESKQNRRDSTHMLTTDHDKSDLASDLNLTDISTEQLPEHLALNEHRLQWQASGQKERRTVRDACVIKKLHSALAYTSNQLPELNKLIKDTGIYALSSILSPLISLVLAPFLTHNLSSSDYGILTLLNTFISLAAGITQLGLGSAFFRAYNYDYTESSDKRDVIATTTMLLFIISLLVIVGITSFAPFLAASLLHHSSFSKLIVIGGCIIFVQNLTLPGFVWLRAESRTVFYALLSIGNLLITLLANIVLVGTLHWGIAGSLVAAGWGYLCIVICTIPFLLSRAGIRIRVGIARNLLGFGTPFVLNIVAYWIVQLSDRYLLSRFSSFTETARYAVVYSLGSALMIVIITPFILAWPTTMFAIVKRQDADQIFKLLFHWFSSFSLLAAFGLSIVALLVLTWLFPPAYHSVAFIIPVIATSCIFFGIYHIFSVGVNIKRKTWMNGVFMTIAAIVNFLMNLVLIPHYGALGAALSTLAAFIVLALVAYIVNQKLYPLPFELGRFVLALFLGVALYTGSGVLAQSYDLYVTCSIYIGALVLYSGCLAMLSKFPARSHKL
ncbi:flippase [Dictyobacter vulcani]|uniref:Flippase n=2 Tax=Dictyobacter vulcani TaxID=2607529 RepID=A0A5J4KG16_9CHLR|nr:flippase [Dictyobacter vulcani]